MPAFGYYSQIDRELLEQTARSTKKISEQNADQILLEKSQLDLLGQLIDIEQANGILLHDILVALTTPTPPANPVVALQFKLGAAVVK